jgi:hypothetical protein
MYGLVVHEMDYPIVMKKPSVAMLSQYMQTFSELNVLVSS